VILHGSGLGTGDPVVLLHGLFGRSQNLGALARRLSSRFRVISLDLRNHGASPHAAGMGYERMAEDVRDTLAGLGVTRASVLGHSMGGKVAMVLALTHPDCVDRLIVADIAPVAYRHSNAAVSAAMLALPLIPGLTRAAAEAYLAEAAPDASVRAFLLQNLIPGATPGWRIGLEHIAADMKLIEGFPAVPDGARFAGPTLFLRGASSGYVKESAWPVVQALFPASVLETVENAGHWLHAEQPEAFASAVERFMA
jgi:pimeloyl-ACP methyl ester carboxylesterase